MACNHTFSFEVGGGQIPYRANASLDHARSRLVTAADAAQRGSPTTADRRTSVFAIVGALEEKVPERGWLRRNRFTCR